MIDILGIINFVQLGFTFTIFKLLRVVASQFNMLFIPDLASE